MCSKFLLDTLLESPRPTLNIYQQLIKESYRIYENNETMKKTIDEFDDKYHPEEAIQWYTKGTFIYRLINMALRTDNILIIFKFRFVIQDIYKQLKDLYEKQKKIFRGRTSSKRSSLNSCFSLENETLKFYHGQRISSKELSSLEHAVGSLISLTSFVSMTKNPEVAMMFSGNGDARPKFESVIFEILINKCDLGNEISPFADVSQLSSMPHEEEVLLCMSTVMHLQSVQIRGSITYIRLRVCPFDNSVLTQMKCWLTRFDTLNVDQEQLEIFKFGWALQSMMDFDRADKMYKALDLSNNPSGHISLSIWSFMAKELLRVGISDDWERLTLAKPLISIFKLFPISDSFRDLLRRLEHIFDVMRNGQPQTFSEVVLLRREQLYVMETLVELAPEHGLPPLPMMSFMKSQVSVLKSMLDDISESNISNENPQTIVHLRELLSMNCPPESYVSHNKQLIYIYEKRNDWSSVIECCQAIINRRELPPNSLEIVQAHLKCGEMYSNLEDISMALLSYTNALQIQHEHHPPDHPLTCKVHIKMGELFDKLGERKTALENYEKASRCPEGSIASEAYNQIGHNYLSERNYHMARLNYTKALTNLERQIPRLEPLMALEHGFLAVVEHYTPNSPQRDFHINQALILSANHGQARQTIVNGIRKLLNQSKSSN